MLHRSLPLNNSDDNNKLFKNNYNCEKQTVIITGIQPKQVNCNFFLCIQLSLQWRIYSRRGCARVSRFVIWNIRICVSLHAERIIHNRVFATANHVPNYMKPACIRCTILMQQIICAHAVIGITVTYTRVRLLKSAYFGGVGARQGLRATINYHWWNEFSKALLAAYSYVSRITVSFKRRIFAARISLPILKNKIHNYFRSAGNISEIHCNAGLQHKVACFKLSLSKDDYNFTANLHLV